MSILGDISVLEAEFGDISKWSECPDFWLSKPDRAGSFIRSLKEAAVSVIGKSAGGRDIISIEYGEKENLETSTDNLNSSIASSLQSKNHTSIFPESFYGTKRRKKPVVVLQGAIHGSELTGTVASLNLCNIIEHGEDLRGKKWPRLQELSRNSRILIIPWLNIDGAERCPIANSSGVPTDLYNRCTFGVAENGKKYNYENAKNIYPVPPQETIYMGSYFNDAGANLQYDYCMPRRQSETVAWMEYYLSERPDGVLIWHCNSGSMLGPPEYYLPEGHKLEFSRLAGAVRSRILREGHRIGRLSLAGLSGMGVPHIEQSTGVYHTCGGMPVMCELPAGGAQCFYSCDEMLDIGLLTIEEVLYYAHTDGLRPYEFWEKVKGGKL